MADRLSCVSENAERVNGDGSEWTVSKDWESNRGLVDDIFQVTEDLSVNDTVDALLRRFCDEPLFVKVIHAIMNMMDNTDEYKAKHAKYRAEQYMIDEGKLWQTKGGVKV